MTDDERRQLKNFEAKVRQLISQYQTVQKENSDLYTELDRKDEEISRLKVELAQCERNYSNLKIAKMIEISDSELKNAKQRISQMVREVNKCIKILTSEETGTEEV